MGEPRWQDIEQVAGRLCALRNAVGTDEVAVTECWRRQPGRKKAQYRDEAHWVLAVLPWEAFHG